MATPASLPPIKTKTYDLALDKLPSDFETYDMTPASLPPSDFETYDMTPASLPPSDTETYDLAPAGPLPSERPFTARQSRHA